MGLFSTDKPEPDFDYEKLWKQYSGWMQDASGEYERAKSVQQARMAQSGMEAGSEQWNRMLDYETRDHRNRVEELQKGYTAGVLKDFFKERKKDTIQTPITREVQGPSSGNVILQGTAPKTGWDNPAPDYSRWSDRDLIESGFTYNDTKEQWTSPEPTDRYTARDDIKYYSSSTDPATLKLVGKGEKIMRSGKDFEQYFAGRWGMGKGEITQEEIRRIGSTSTFSIFK